MSSEAISGARKTEDSRSNMAAMVGLNGSSVDDNKSVKYCN